MINSNFYYVLFIFFVMPLTLFAQNDQLRPDEHGIHADWFEADEPNGSALIFLGGSEGGNGFGNSWANYFNNKGFHVLSLAYFKINSLPGQLELVPVEITEKAVEWIQAHHGGSIDKIGLIGASKGAELALISATLGSEIEALVLISPSSVVWQSINEEDWTSTESSWTLNGEPLPFLRYDFSRGFDRIFNFYDAAIENMEGTEAVIKAEEAGCPILILSGAEDNLWPSLRMAEMITTRLGEFDYQYPVYHRNYEDSGHMLLHPSVVDGADMNPPAQEQFDFLGGSPDNFIETGKNVLAEIEEFIEKYL